MVATSFGEYEYPNKDGPVVDVRVLMNWKEKQLEFECITFPEKTKVSYNFSHFPKLEEGVRFATSITYKNEFVEVLKVSQFL